MVCYAPFVLCCRKDVKGFLVATVDFVVYPIGSYVNGWKILDCQALTIMQEDGNLCGLLKPGVDIWLLGPGSGTMNLCKPFKELQGWGRQDDRLQKKGRGNVLQGPCRSP